MYYPIAPVTAPRMTRRDKWLKPARPCVARYRAFKDEVNLRKVVIPDECRVKFFIPMPQSWSKKKKDLMHLQPHTQTPDIDNLLKALFDSVFDDDSHIHTVHACKVWSYEGGIAVERIIR